MKQNEILLLRYRAGIPIAPPPLLIMSSSQLLPVPILFKYIWSCSGSADSWPDVRRISTRGKISAEYLLDVCRMSAKCLSNVIWMPAGLSSGHLANIRRISNTVWQDRTGTGTRPGQDKDGTGTGRGTVGIPQLSLLAHIISVYTHLRSTFANLWIWD